MAAATITSIQRGAEQFQGVFSDLWQVKATLDGGAIADGAGETNTVAVPGVEVGDMVLGISYGADAVDMTITGYVQAANAVELRIQNESGSSFSDPAAVTVKMLIGRPAW